MSNCFKNIGSSNLADIKNCVEDPIICRNVEHMYTDKIKKCITTYSNNLFYVKLSIDRDSFNKIRYEYYMYSKINKTKYKKYFEKIPYFFEDSTGVALVFQSDINSIPIMRCSKDMITQEIYDEIVRRLQELYDNKIYISDMHDANVIYNIKNKKIYFIDLENMFIQNGLTDIDNEIYRIKHSYGIEIDIDKIKVSHIDYINYWKSYKKYD